MTEEEIDRIEHEFCEIIESDPLYTSKPFDFDVHIEGQESLSTFLSLVGTIVRYVRIISEKDDEAFEERETISKLQKSKSLTVIPNDDYGLQFNLSNTDKNGVNQFLVKHLTDKLSDKEERLQYLIDFAYRVMGQYYFRWKKKNEK